MKKRYFEIGNIYNISDGPKEVKRKSNIRASKFSRALHRNDNKIAKEGNTLTALEWSKHFFVK